MHLLPRCPAAPHAGQARSGCRHSTSKSMRCLVLSSRTSRTALLRVACSIVSMTELSWKRE